MEYIFEKKYYFSLLGCLIVTIVAVSVIYLKTQQNAEIANLNEGLPPIDIVDVASNNTPVDSIIPEQEFSVIPDEPRITIHDEQIVLDYPISQPQEVIIPGKPLDVAEQEKADQEKADQEKADQEKTIETFKVEEPQAIASNVVIEETLPVFSFTAESKLLLPITGEIMMSFSTDTPVFFKTLNQYRINQALRIKAEVGAEVMAAADGIVSAIAKDFAKGYSITIDHGNGYQTVYSQLQEKMNVKEGQVVTKGNVIAYVDNPTTYFSLEGSHLCFEVFLDAKTINPDDLL